MSAYFTIHPIKLETGAMRLVCQDCGWSKVYRSEVPLSEVNGESWLHELSNHDKDER